MIKYTTVKLLLGLGKDNIRVFAQFFVKEDYTMPWKVFREHGKFCLHKVNPDGGKGDLVHCHDTAEMARRQQAALYVSEKKEITPEDAIIIDEDNDGVEYKEYYDAPIAYMVTGAHSFAELDAERGARERVAELSSLTSDFQNLMGNIVYTPVDELEADKLHELDSLYDEFKSRLTSLVNEPMDDDEESDKAKLETSSKNDLPDSAFLYIEPGGKKDESGKTVPRSLRHLPVKHADGSPDPAHIRNAIARANQVKLASGKTISSALANRLKARAQGMLKRTKKESSFDTFVRTVKEKLGIKEDEPEPYSNMTVWKEVDGSYGWLSAYSSKFLDRDTPPDIIASTAHKEFVEKVDKGEAPLPDLWLWHVPEWKIGYATALAYDDSGFPIAMGKFDDSLEAKEIAEWLSKQTDFGVSHGMYNRTIQRNSDDPSVITAYETFEISPLPMARAAMDLAEYFVIKNEVKELEEHEMTIPTEKRDELLKRGLPDSILSALEKRNQAKAEAALAEGRKEKETETAASTETTQPVPETTQTTEVAKTEVSPAAQTPEKKDDEPVKEDNFPTRQEVAEAVSNVIAPMLEDFGKQIAELNKQLTEQAQKLAEVQMSDEKRIKEIIAMTPRDSLASLMSARLTDRAAFSKQTKVGENDNLLKTKPREEEAKETPGAHSIGIPFVDKFLQDGK